MHVCISWSYPASDGHVLFYAIPILGGVVASVFVCASVGHVMYYAMPNGKRNGIKAKMVLFQLVITCKTKCGFLLELVMSVLCPAHKRGMVENNKYVCFSWICPEPYHV